MTEGGGLVGCWYAHRIFGVHPTMRADILLRGYGDY